MIRILALPLLLLSLNTGAAPQAEPWPRWEAHDPNQTADIDHSAWTALLQRYLHTQTRPHRFAYGAVTEADRKVLRDYLTQLQRIAIGEYARPAQMAYWINLYNALTVNLVIEHYPVASIRKINISPGLFRFGPWDAELARVDGQALTLNDIEHRILRPLFADPRIHYAVNCASLGCPDLQPQAYTAATLETMLERGAREFVNHPRGARVGDRGLVVSSIYAWFEDDFGGDDAGVIAHLRRFAEPDLARALATVTRIADDRYDWSLNDAPARAR